MGMTNQVCPLREKSGERLLAHRIRWGPRGEVPAPGSKIITFSRQVLALEKLEISGRPRGFLARS
jgi:hypothetical protein